MEIRKIKQLEGKVIVGISQLLLREVIIKAIAIVGQLTLIRILKPEFFGIYAIIAFVTSIAELLTNLGLSTAIIQQKKEITQSEINSVLTIRIGISAVVLLLLMLLLPVVLNVYPGLKDQSIFLVPLFSLTLLLKPIKNTAIALLEKEIRYKNIAKIDWWGMVVYYVVAIFSALNGFAVFSFVLAVVLKEFFEMMLSIYYMPVKIRIGFSYSSIRKLLNFGLLFQVGNVLSFINSSLIPLVGGKLLSSEHLGYLVWSKNISSLPNTILDNYGRAAFSGIARIQENLELVSKAINKSIYILNFAIFFFVVMIISYLYDFTYFVVSEKWLFAVPALFWFLVGSLFSGIIVAVGQGLMAVGKVKEMTTYSIFITVFELVLALSLLKLIGFTGIAIAVFANSVCQFICFTFLAIESKLELRYAKQFLSILFILLLCYYVAQMLNGMLETSFLSYVLKLLTTAILYWVLCFIFMKEEFYALVTISKSFLHHDKR